MNPRRAYFTEPLGKDVPLAIDHSRTYREFSVRNIGHMQRLRSIMREIEKMDQQPISSICDIGCSNGFITSLLSQRWPNANVSGLDHSIENLAKATKEYPHISFLHIDLNVPTEPERQYDLVTCFETLEHVGNIGNAISNIWKRVRPGGRMLVTVPIEHGPVGIMKYALKTAIYKYSLKEIKVSRRTYLRLLLSGERISQARPESKGYGTHYGFDYRDVDDALFCLGARINAFNRITTRFYYVERTPELKV